jgi:hypothetical protein
MLALEAEEPLLCQALVDHLAMAAAMAEAVVAIHLVSRRYRACRSACRIARMMTVEPVVMTQEDADESAV